MSAARPGSPVLSLVAAAATAVMDESPRPVPGDGRLLDRRARPRRDGDEGNRRVAVADVGLDDVVVVAFGAEHGDCRLAGFLRAAAGFQAAGGRRRGRRDRLVDLGLQRLVERTAHLDALRGRRLGGSRAGAATRGPRAQIALVELPLTQIIREQLCRLRRNCACPFVD